MTEFSKVTQADREAAAALCTKIIPTPPEAFRSGAKDDHWLTQAFARHRIAALSGLDEAIEGLEQASDWLEAEPVDGKGPAELAVLKRLIVTIRTLTDKLKG